MSDRSVNRIALVNPCWNFEGSRYWACREPHLPLELLYPEALLLQEGFTTLLLDAHLENLSPLEAAEQVDGFGPDLIVLTTAPTYLFWRCPPPELEVPRVLCGALSAIAPVVAIGPHGSATPGYALEQLGCRAVVRGEPEEELVRVARGKPSPATVWAGDRPGGGGSREGEAPAEPPGIGTPRRGGGSPQAPGIRPRAVREDPHPPGQPPGIGTPRRCGGPPHPPGVWPPAVREDPHPPAEPPGRGAAAPSTEVARVDVRHLPSLQYRGYPLEMRTHRHHVFWGEGRGAEVEFSRGCPYGCSFCNRRFFRSRYRERPLEKVLAELMRLKGRGIDYVYFIDEVFGLGRCELLLQALIDEPIVQFGCQTRIDLWDEARLDRLSAAGCISVEFGLESPFPDVQGSLNKGYRMDPDRIMGLLAHAKSRIPWVQGDLVEPFGADDETRSRTDAWRREAIDRGVWISEPVQLFLYPGSDLHDRMIGPVDDESWDRAREWKTGNPREAQ